MGSHRSLTAVMTGSEIIGTIDTLSREGCEEEELRRLRSDGYVSRRVAEVLQASSLEQVPATDYADGTTLAQLIKLGAVGTQKLTTSDLPFWLFSRESRNPLSEYHLDDGQPRRFTQLELLHPYRDEVEIDYVTSELTHFVLEPAGIWELMVLAMSFRASRGFRVIALGSGFKSARHVVERFPALECHGGSFLSLCAISAGEFGKSDRFLGYRPI